MVFKNFKSVPISRLGIGTVQFGFDYGINNQKGQVTYEEVLTILARAREGGVNFLDTSRAYGTSEEVLGKAIAELNAGADFSLCTKLDLPPKWQELSEREVMDHAKSSFEKSMEALKADSIPFYLLHNMEYYRYGGGTIWEFVKEMQKAGHLGHIGVSIGIGPEEALEALEDDRVEVIQIPYNLFDWRWDKAGVLTAAAARNVMVVNRSTYLQGLLVMPLEDVEEKLSRAVPYRKRLDELVRKCGCNLKELVLHYVFSNQDITTTILGVDTPDQFTENLSIFNNDNVPAEILHEAQDIFKDVPEEVLNPSLWNQPYKGNEYNPEK